MIGAILRAQMLSMRLRVGTRRAGTIFSSLTGLLFYGVWAFVGWGVLLFFSSPNNAPYFTLALSTGLLFAMVYWQLAPVIAASFGASLDLRKLLAYPIPHRDLFLVELMLRVTSCGEMLLLLLATVAGLLRNPLFGWKASPFIIGASVLFAGMNILLSAGTRNLLERVILRTRLKELVLLLFLVVSLLPQLLLANDVKKWTLFRWLPQDTVWPWGAMAHLMLRDQVPLASTVAVAFFALAYFYSHWQFERSLRYDEQAGSGRVYFGQGAADKVDLTARLLAIPGSLLRDPLGALCEKELRTFFRIPRFRLVYAMSCFFGIVLYLPQLRHPNPESFFRQNALPIMGVYGLMMMGQISYWNAFGFDRSAIQGYFSWPVAFRDALVSKNLATAILLVPQVILISIFAVLLHMPVSVAKVAETAVVVLIASLYWFSMGNICSVRIPRAMNPEKMSQMSNKLQALSIWSAPILLLPVALAYWCRYLFHNDWLFTGVLLIAGIIGGVFYFVGLDSAVTWAERNREKMIVQLSQSDGPLSIA